MQLVHQAPALHLIALLLLLLLVLDNMVTLVERRKLTACTTS
jgi:hypothetical protein